MCLLERFIGCRKWCLRISLGKKKYIVRARSPHGGIWFHRGDSVPVPLAKDYCPLQSYACVYEKLLLKKTSQERKKEKEKKG